MNIDAQIAQRATLQPIGAIAQRLGLDRYEPYGAHKAKIDPQWAFSLPSRRGKLVLVTAINPTPAGEGKTTVTIGLSDALNQRWWPCGNRRWGRCSASRAAPPAVARPRWCPWRTSTCISPAISTP